MIVLNREYLEQMFGKFRLITVSRIILKELDISQIDSNAFQGLDKITDLSFEENLIEDLAENVFQDLSNLNVLYLSQNRLAHLDSNVFAKTTKLVILELSDNLLESLSPSIFANLLNLKELDLHSNHLKQIDSNLFKGLRRLEELELNDNEIKNIDVGSFDDLGKLKLLKLNSNILKIIDRKCFEPLKEIHVIQLYDNDCKYQSYLLPMTEFENWNFDKEKLDQYGFRYEWEDFLEQFPKLETKRNRTKSENEKLELERSNKQLDEEVKETRLKKEKEKTRANDNEKSPKPSTSKQNESDSKSKQEKSEKPTNSNGNANTGIPNFHDTMQDPYIGKTFINRYRVKKPLGSGTFGQVFLVEDLNHKIDKALKIMNKNCSSSETESIFLLNLSHENIIRYFDHFIQQISDSKCICMVTEFCEHEDLKKQIDKEKAKEKEKEKEKGKIPEKSIVKWMYQAANGLKFLHEKKIIHRDIKPANMLLKADGMLKLADLGVAKWLEGTVGRTMTGSLSYMSPEQFNSIFKKETYDYPTDIWSLGCVLYELKYLKMAFPDGQAKDPAIPNDMDEDSVISSLIKKMLVKLPSDRIETQQLYVQLMALNSIYEVK